ncbi:MAG: replicative DNA helicase [Alphaproteobacteria bacterium RIFCSPLOWO2_01_FULL_40_26]|nr:MAG: replicative DNA helicase [Alphaproteobacteria bacterium RIFCSPHIGHO2_02_FULL_40_34]OFW87552.1 MAG: replicative DNA helicase [Alphaproteobacteria bacterium RIFCSPHIGHO2_01_FULL_40_8]OFW94490.1 MAG: replicative DNA helicase [Alphaproteobacteria bacterium RIFCSPLOWO2_01_FULL_40_26]OFX10201.1 MAG: replicative DNA helicase [Alphaproteobacteria bacterium RIFCSPLOWO2_02_FULL_40_19]OFX11224.1 MAG: replicative DNA helicase [Alphaproteobacteria bacterium RIFCSPLOWO2_12_FULL_40_11]
MELEIRKELFNVEAEQAVLGTIILNNEYLNRVAEFLLPDHFYESAHQKIFAQILHNIEHVRIVANQVTLKQFFDSDPAIKAVGGALYLSTLLSSASAIIDIADYGRVIHDLALKRQLVMVGEDVVNRVFNVEEKTSAAEQIELAESSLFKLSEHGNGRSDFRNISSSIKDTLDKTLLAKQRDSHISGISTGLTDLDKILSGMQQSDLIILAARPSMGKTALGINVAVNACKFLNEDLEDQKDKKAVGFFSLEMSSDQLAARILSMECSINATKFRTGQLNETEWEAVAVRSAEISKLPLFIDDTPALSISAIRTRARRMVRKNNLAFLVVDYLQLVRPTTTRANDGRVQEVSEITQGLKAIAKEFNIPVLALSQLSRAVEQREDKHPQLSDLRESGAIEQDADVVAFIYRDAYYLERKRPPESESDRFNQWKNKMQEMAHKAEIIIAKQRNGPVGSLNLFFDAEFTRFGNLDIYHK